MKTHDYTSRYWGHDYAITDLLPGNCIRITGWGHGLKAGDFILLENEGDSTRYKLEAVDYLGNPSDMWRAKARFAPRPGRRAPVAA